MIGVLGSPDRLEAKHYKLRNSFLSWGLKIPLVRKDGVNIECTKIFLNIIVKRSNGNTFITPETVSRFI
jgi:hypothetical protein